MEQPTPLTPARPATVMFADAAKVLAGVARSHGLAAPSFRTPPRTVGLDRTVRRTAQGGAVAVRVKGRPWPAVIADMIDGVIAVNRLPSPKASRVRADLWDAVLDRVADAVPVKSTRVA
jgi:hypothetical protein